MDKQLHNSEVRELAKRIYLNKLSEKIDDFRYNIEEQAVKEAESLIKELYKRGYYDDDVSKPNDRMLKVLQTPINKMNVRMDNCLRAYDIINATIADVLKLGRKKVLTLSGIGKKAVVDIDEFLDKNGIDWDLDLTQYGL